MRGTDVLRNYGAQMTEHVKNWNGGRAFAVTQEELVVLRRER